MVFEIQMKPRSTAKKETKQLRRNDYIPVVIYSKEKQAEHTAIPKAEFDAIIRQIEPGSLSTTVFHLKDSQGKVRKAIVKDIHYKVTSYNVIHLDFQEIFANELVQIKVPIQCLNLIDCVGVKAGGNLRLVKRYLEVKCPATQIPPHFEVDVRNLEMFHSIQVKQVQMPKHIVPIDDPNDAVVSVTKK